MHWDPLAAEAIERWYTGKALDAIRSDVLPTLARALSEDRWPKGARYQHGSWTALVDGEWTLAHDIGVLGPTALLQEALPRVEAGEPLTVLAVEWRGKPPSGVVAAQSGTIFYCLVDPAPAGFDSLTADLIRQRLSGDLDESEDQDTAAALDDGP